MLDTSKLAIAARMELPLFGTANDFALEKEFEFDIKDTSDLDVESVTIRIFVTNGFPIDVNTQIYFLDEARVKIDSLINPAQTLIASAAPVDGSGRVIAPTSTSSDNKLNKLQWKQITQRCRYMSIVSNLESAPNGTDVKIFSDYTLGVKLAMRAKLNVDLKKDSE